jgi:hypothetical protein
MRSALYFPIGYPPVLPPPMSTPPKSAAGTRRGTPPHRRRTATAVLAGEFDEKPPRDVLTSVLNGVPAYDAVESRKKEGGEEEMPAVSRVQRDAHGANGTDGKRANVSLPSNAPAHVAHVAASIGALSSSSRQSSGTPRPSAFARVIERSRSVTPPPPIMLPSPVSTPAPSTTASSRASSKRPRTPDDDEELASHPGPSISPIARPPKRKRGVARKGWKGWVEGSPPPSDKLINLDHAIILTNRRTRSGRNFDS